MATTILGDITQDTDLADLLALKGDYQPGGMTGLRLLYSSATAVILEAGACRASDGSRNLTLTQTTLTITTQGVGGLDETTLSATATTNGTTAVTMSASIYSETPLSSTVRTLTGTLTSSGTAVTGSGTKFLSEVAINDVIRSASNGASRVTAIASDTALTIVAAFPGGDVGVGQAITSYENLTLWPDTGSASDKRRVNTISHAGTAVVLSSAVTSSASGRTVRVGVEVASCWFFPWVVYGTSGTSAVLSTQRTRPYSASGYTTAWRRVPVAQFNNSSGNLDIVYDQTGTGPVRQVAYDEQRSDHYALSAGTATSFTSVAACPAIPPTARSVRLTLVLTGSTVSSGSAQYLVVRSRGGTASTDGEISAQAAATATLVAQARNTDTLTMNGSQAFDYYITPAAASGTPAYVIVIGWMEAS